MRISEPAGRNALAWLLLSHFASAGCSDESQATIEAATQEASSDAQTSDVTQRPADIEPATLMLHLEDSELMLPASARVSSDADGKVSFFAESRAADETFSLRLAVSNKDEPLQEQTFELEPGAGQANQISLFQGDLPDAIIWRSVDGTAQFERFDKDHFELTFDAELSLDPRGGGKRTKATGKLHGGALFVCQKAAAPAVEGQAHASSGQNETTASVSDRECRALLAKLVSD